MPYLRLDLPGTYPVEVKRELATRLCELYAEVMETQVWRANVGIAELGKDNLYHLGSDGLERIAMVMVEFGGWEPRGERYADLKTIKQPTLVLNGNDDIMVPTINSFTLSQHIPNAQLIVYPDSGHGALFQYPELFVAHTKLFLDARSRREVLGLEGA